MSKIVIDARELRTSTGRYIERLLHYLQDIDTQNDYTVLLKPKDMGGWEPTNRRFTKLASTYKEFTFAEQLGLLKQVRSLRADLVHFGKTEQPILYTGKVVTTIHDLTTLRFPNPSKNRIVFGIKQRVYGWVNKIVAHKSKTIITPTNYVADDVAKYAGINIRKVTVTYESADKIVDPAEAMPEVEGKKFIMYTGRPTPHKNLDRLIEAFAVLRAKHPELVLVLVGRTDKLYRRTAKRAAAKGIDGVIFTGFVSEGQLRWLYENAAAYIFPSLSEGFGLPALEAMVHGCPVVSSRATCLPEVYGDGALYFDPLDIEDMAAKIGRVLSSKKLRARLIESGHQQARKYSWRRMAQQTLDVYNKVLS